MRRLLLAAALGAAGCNGETLPTMSLGSSRPQVRILATRLERRDALLRFGPAEPFVPLLLAYPEDRIQHLYSRGVPRAFDLVFVSKGGVVVEQARLPRNSLEGVTSSKPAAYVLVLAEGGWSAGGMQVGQSVTLPPVGEPQGLWSLGFEGKPDVVHVEAALTADEWSRGLMYRAAMSENDGMLFKYPDRRRHGFWMRNTRIALDIAFFNEDGRIVTLHAGMKPEQEEPRYESGLPVQYALEVNAGWFQKRGIRVGDRVLLPQDAKDARAGD
jgi:hypothetical protein